MDVAMDGKFHIHGNPDCHVYVHVLLHRDGCSSEPIIQCGTPSQKLRSCIHW